MHSFQGRHLYSLAVNHRLPAVTGGGDPQETAHRLGSETATIIDRQMPSRLYAAQECLPGLRLGKIRNSQTQRLIGFPQLEALALQVLDGFMESAP